MKKITERTPIGSLIAMPAEWAEFATAARYFATDRKTNRAFDSAYMIEQIQAGFDPLRFEVAPGVNLLGHVVSSNAANHFDALLNHLDLESVALDKAVANGLVEKSFSHTGSMMTQRLMQAGLAGFSPEIAVSAKNDDQFSAVLDNLQASGVTEGLDSLMNALLTCAQPYRARIFLDRNFPVEGASDMRLDHILQNVWRSQNQDDVVLDVCRRYPLRDYIARNNGCKENSPLPLVEARKNYGPMLRLALSLGLDVNGRDKAGLTGLMHEVTRVSGDNPDLVQQWIDAGAEINAQDKEGNSVLHKAVKANLIKSVDLLFAAGVDMQVRNAKGALAFAGMALPSALYCHHLLGRTIPYGKNLAMIATEANWVEKVREAYAAGDAPGHLDDYGDNVLRLALKSKAASAELFLALEEAGVDMNTPVPTVIPKKDKLVVNLHPLHHLLVLYDEASSKARLFMAAYLQKTKTIDINCLDHEGQTPLYRAVRLGEHEFVAPLLEAGADVTIRCGRMTLKALAKSEPIKQLLMVATTEQEVGRSLVQAATDGEGVSRRNPKISGPL